MNHRLRIRISRSRYLKVPTPSSVSEECGLEMVTLSSALWVTPKCANVVGVSASGYPVANPSLSKLKPKASTPGPVFPGTLPNRGRLSVALSHHWFTCNKSFHCKVVKVFEQHLQLFLTEQNDPQQLHSHKLHPGDSPMRLCHQQELNPRSWISSIHPI